MTLDIEKYRTAAVLMCERMGVEPYKPCGSGEFWEPLAERMAEHCLMVEVLTECGYLTRIKE